MILSTTDEIIGALERGELAKDIAEQLREVITACQEQEGKGKFALKLAITAKGDMVTIKAAIETTVPKRDRRSSNFFVTRDGQLSLQHPDQVDMDFSRARRSAVDAS